MTRRPEPAMENEPLHLQAAGWYARKRAGYADP